MLNNLKIERTLKNLTQQDLAHLVGVSRQSINAIEVNKYIPSTVLSLKIAKVLDKKMEELFMLELSD